MDRFVGEQPEGSHSVVLEVTCPKGMAGSTEEYFESEMWKVASPELLTET